MVPYLVLIGACVVVGRITHAIMERKMGEKIPWTLAHFSTQVILGCVFSLIIILLGGFK